MTISVYDMMRAKAKSMGHAAAKLPDSVWQTYLDVRDEWATLRNAKLYVENYMMGNLDPAEFAQVMAEDDNLRWTISDLCRMRLESTDPDIPERNNSYIDIGAGLKTFWTEIRVPLPSEIDAARDIRNINFGIEAGKAAAGSAPVKEDTINEEETASDKKRSVREVLDDAKKRTAEKAEPKPLDESYLETDEGGEYRNEYTYMGARQIENMAMNIEAGKDVGLHPDERKKALEAAGIPEGKVNELVLDSDYHNYAKLVDEYLKETGANLGDLDLVVYVPPKEELFTEQDMEFIDGNGKQSEEQTKFKSGYSEEALNRSLNDELQVVFDQIEHHASRDRTNEHNRDHRRNNKQQNNGQQDNIKQSNGRQREGYVNGIFEGKPVSFKGSFKDHTFTQDELDKLIAGETVSVDYTDKNNKLKTVSVKLEWQQYEGHDYLGFKADFSKKAAQGQAAVNIRSGSDTEDMAGYQSEDFPASYPEEEDGIVQLSAADVAALFDGPGIQM